MPACESSPNSQSASPNITWFVAPEADGVMLVAYRIATAGTYQVDVAINASALPGPETGIVGHQYPLTVRWRVWPVVVASAGVFALFTC